MNLNVVLTNAYRYSMGDLVCKEVQLPLQPQNLQKIIKDLLSAGGEELFISEWSSDLNIDEYSNLEELNSLLCFAQENDLIEEAISLLNYDLWVKPNMVKTRLLEEDYKIIFAENDEELGRFVVEHDLIEDSHLISEIPEEYVDFKKIGYVYSINHNATQWNGRYIFWN